MDVNDPEGKWTGRISAEGGFHFERLWRGVTDHHLIEATFIGSAEARKLHTLAMEQAENYAVASRLVAAKTAAAQNTDEDRSEEHTSELQSLMRISYAVFCLKKKKK